MPIDKKTGKAFFVDPLMGRIEGFKNIKEFNKAVRTYNKKHKVKPLKKNEGGFAYYKGMLN